MCIRGCKFVIHDQALTCLYQLNLHDMVYSMRSVYGFIIANRCTVRVTSWTLLLIAIAHWQAGVSRKQRLNLAGRCSLSCVLSE